MRMLPGCQQFSPALNEPPLPGPTAAAPRRPLAALTLVALAAMAALPGAALAQTAPSAVQRQVETLQRQQQEQLQRDQDAQRPAPGKVDGVDTRSMRPGTTLPTLPAGCHAIDVLQIERADLLSAHMREQLDARFAGRCLAAPDIEQLLGALTRYYIDAGYVSTRAYLPPQDLSTRRLRVLVIEGRIGKLSVEDGGANSLWLPGVLPRAQGGVLNLRDLEQAIDQLNRLPSNDAKLDIRPGASAGSSDVVLLNKPSKRLNFMLSTDNQGQPSTGRQQTGLGITADNLIGLNEQFTLNHRRAIPGDREREYSDMSGIGVSLPIGYSLLSFSAGNSSYTSTLQTPGGQALKANGDNRLRTLRLDQVIYRDQSVRVTASGALTSKKSRNYLDNQYLGVSSRNLSVLDLELNVRAQVAGGVASLTLGHAKGLTSMKALRDPDNLPDDYPHAQFGVNKLSVDYTRDFQLAGLGWNFATGIVAQKAEDTLYGSEQISIGGLYTVRGFVNNTLAGDDGYHWHNELALVHPFSVAGGQLKTRWFIGYDMGRVSNRAPDIPQGRLSGAAVGVSAGWGDLSASLMHTRAVSAPAFMTKESGQTWFRLSYRF